MVIRKAFQALVFLGLCACGNNVPQKSNVLNRPVSHQRKPASTKNPEQTVFSKPEQITRNNKQNNTEAVLNRADREKETYTTRTTTATSSSQLSYRSSQYYKYITDSTQVSAKPTYEKNIDDIITQISKNPAQKKNPAVNSDWYASVNFNIRKPNFVVLHHTAQNSAEQTLFTFSISRTQTSAHYVVGRDGVVYQMLNDYVRAWHAGNGKWGNITDMNSCSLGIEIDNNGSEPFSDEQITALIKLLDYLKNQYGIPQANFIAHSDLAPGRKSDPSKFFPWKRLADSGFGFWYNTNNLPTPPSDFNALLALRVMGYDISNQANAITSFKLHYIQNDVSSTLNDYDKKVLYNLYMKF